MLRAVRLFVGAALVLVGLLLAACGLFAILYGGDDAGGETHVSIIGKRMDADVAGAGALLVALAAVLVALPFLIGGRRSAVARDGGRF